MSSVEAAFSPSDVQGDARAKLKTLHMAGGMTADNYIAKFRTAASQSGISDDAALIKYFMEGIPTSLCKKISMMDNAPTTLDGWTGAASKFNNSYRHAKAIMACICGRNTKPTAQAKKTWQPA